MKYIKKYQAPWSPLDLLNIKSSLDDLTDWEKLRNAAIEARLTKAKKEAGIVTANDKLEKEILSNIKYAKTRDAYKEEYSQILNSPYPILGDLDEVEKLAGTMTPGMSSFIFGYDAFKDYKSIIPALKYGLYADAGANWLRGGGNTLFAVAGLTPLSGLFNKGLTLARNGLTTTKNLFQAPKLALRLGTYRSLGTPGYPYYYNPETGLWDMDALMSDASRGKQELIDWMNNPAYREASAANVEEAERLKLKYVPYHERPEYLELIENPINVNSKQLDPSIFAETNATNKKITINTYTSQPANQAVRHEAGHLGRLGAVSQYGANNWETGLKELEYLKYKASQIFKEESIYADAVDLSKNSFEGIQNMKDLGESMGIVTGLAYPGYEAAYSMLENASKINQSKGGLVSMLKLDRESMPLVWKALNGTFYVTAATLASKWALNNANNLNYLNYLNDLYISNGGD